VEFSSAGASIDEGSGDVDGDSTTASLPLVAEGLPSRSSSELGSPAPDDNRSAHATSRSISSLSCSTLARSQRAMSNGSNRREEDTSHQHRSARRITAGNGVVIDEERAAVMTVAKVALVAQELDTVDVSGMGCQ